MKAYIYLLVAAVWIASLVGVGKWQNAAGKTSERVVWQDKEIKQLAASAKKIKELQDAARAKEQENAAKIAAIGAEHAKDRKALEARRARDVAAALNGAFGLRIPGACPVRPNGSPTPEARPAASGGDGGATVELPRQVTADLFTLVNDADETANALRACQRIVIEDRK